MELEFPNEDIGKEGEVFLMQKSILLLAQNVAKHSCSVFSEAEHKQTEE